MLDNFDSIQNLMQNNKDCFYVISIIQRAKDFENEFSERKHKEHFIRHYFVKDAKELLDIKQNIIDICKMYNARAYFGLDAKNIKKVIAEQIKVETDLLVNSEQAIQIYRKNFQSIPRKAECSESKLRYVHVDTDFKNTELLNALRDVLNPFKLTEINSPNGVHFVGRIRREDGNIDVQKLGNTLADFRTKNNIKDNELELKKNSMIVLYK